jgi:hypothetical protein
MRLFLCVCFQLSFLCLFAQEENIETNPSDTLKLHSPKKAVIFSALLPGAGQVYNHIAMPKGKKKAFWKVPLIYAGLGATGYFLVSNQLTQKALKNEYTNRQNGGLPDLRWEQYDNEGILTLYNQYLTKRDLSILGVGAVYLFQIVDAGIEAHFVDFDISEDLSMTFRPALIGPNTAGVAMRLNFH